MGKPLTRLAEGPPSSLSAERFDAMELLVCDGCNVKNVYFINDVK
jgi:hypothetical protein